MDYKKVIEEAQDVLASCLVPDGITAEQAIEKLLGILDNRDLVAYMRYQDALTAAAGNAKAIIHGYGGGPVLLIGDDTVFGGLTDAAFEQPKPMPIVIERLAAAEYFHEKPLHPKHQAQQERRVTRKKRG